MTPLITVADLKDAADRKRRAATGEGRVLCSLRITGPDVLARSVARGWTGEIADALVASGRPDLGAYIRKAALVARVRGTATP